MDGVATVGSETAFARGDHIHPSDTSKQDVIDANNKLDYSYLTNTPTIPSAPGTLDTNNADAQNTSSSEALSGTVKLHKVSKTGSYNDLLNKPTIPDVSNFITKSVNDLTYYYTKTDVDSKIASTYKAAGSVSSVSNLGSLNAAHEGFVYNMSASFTTTSDFVEGSGVTYPAGTNVAIVNTNTSADPVYKYDILSGFVDLSGKQDVIDSNNKLSYNYLSDTPTIPTVPTISTSIITDASSDVMTASPKAVKTYVDDQFTELTSAIIDTL